MNDSKQILGQKGISFEDIKPIDLDDIKSIPDPDYMGFDDIEDAEGVDEQ